MPTSTSVMTANLMRLAATQFNDATAFVAIMQENNYIDYRINDPVVINTVTPCVAGQQNITFPPIKGIKLGDFMYCNGLATSSVVTGVTYNYSVPVTSFCVCQPKTSTTIVVPPQGDILSTFVTIAPGLDFSLAVGSRVIFTIGTQTDVVFPDTLPLGSNGVPT